MELRSQGRVSKRRKSQSPATIVEVNKPLTPSRATWLVMRREAKLEDQEKDQLARLQGHEGAIAEAIELTQDFAELVRQRQPDQLERCFDSHEQLNLRLPNAWLKQSVSVHG